MIRYLVARLVQAVIALWVVTTIVFVLMKLIPGSVARAVLGRQAFPANVAVFNHANGFDQPVIVQYERFLDSLMHGQLTFAPPHVHAVSAVVAGYAQGVSMQQLAQIPLRNTLILLVLSFLVATPLGLAAGIWLALGQGTRPLRGTFRIGAGAIYVIPSFYLAVILLQVFSVWTHLLPDNFPDWTMGDVLSDPRGLVAPVLSLALGSAAMITRFAENSAADCLLADYVRTARAKGASVPRIVIHHVLRNSAVTVLTVLQTRLAVMFSIAVPVEVFFHYPGIEFLTWRGAMSNDIYTVLGAIVLIGAVVLALSLVVDLVYTLLDPRIRYVT